MSAIPKVPLSSVVLKTTGGGTPERDNVEYWNGGIPWATVKDFKDGVYHLKAIKEEISEKGLSRSSSHLIPEGTPIVCTRMAVGRIARASIPVAINQDLRALHIREDFDTDYVVWAIDSIRHRIENVSVGSTVKGISLDQLLSFEIEAPPKPEQTKIAEILSTVDRAIEQTEALIAKQQRLKTGLMQDLLTRGIDEHGRIRSEETHEFKDSPLGRIPVEWEVSTLGEEIGPIIGGWSPTCEREPAAIGEWGVLKTTACVWDGYDETENKRLPEDLRPVQKAEVVRNDILITRKGPMDRVGVVVHVHETRPQLMVPDTVFKTRILEDSEMLPEFLPIALGSTPVQRGWSQKKIGLAEAQVNLNHSILRETPIFCPSKDEQMRIVETLFSARMISGTEFDSLSKLWTLKAALMQDLLTGDVRVTSLLNREGIDE